MSLTLIPSNLGLVRGFNGVGEAGINADTFRLTVTPEIDDYLAGIDGMAICNAVGDPQGELEITGEFKANTGVVSASFVTAFSPSNSTNNFGRSQGGFYLKSGEKSIGRTEWLKITTRFQSRWNIP